LHNPTPRSHGLDTLRSVAILAVIFFHLSSYHGETVPDALVPVARLGWMGVDLFFVLSGFLIGSQLLRPHGDGEPISVWGFYRNRGFRILPAYLVVLALYFMVPGWTEDSTLSPLWQYLTFTFNLFVDYGNHQAFSQVWSLCVEEHFYLLLPLIVLLMVRRPSARKTTAVITGLVLFGIVVRGFFLFHTLRPMAQRGDAFGAMYIERIYYPTYSRLDGLLAGVSLALVRTFRPAWWSVLARRGHTLFVLGASLIAICVLLFNDRFVSVSGASAVSVVIGFPLLALALALLVASALSTNGWLRLKIPGARLCATLAYCLYLTQKELLHLVDLRFPRLEQVGRLPWLLVYLAVCFLVAGALHLCIERPFLLLRDRRCTPARSDIKVQSSFPHIPEPAGEDQSAL
jgi:peptidoglycan/LPS O-acetylase OafA/YrhL